MRLFFWRARGAEAEGGREPDAGIRRRDAEPASAVWERHVLSRDPDIASGAIREAADNAVVPAIAPLMRLAKSGDLFCDDAMDAIWKIVAGNPGNIEILSMVPALEEALDPRAPSEELWVLSAILEANRGAFLGLAPKMISLLDSYSKRGEADAVAEVAACLGNIGDSSAIGPLCGAYGSGTGNDSLRETITDALLMLGQKKAYLS